jgi:diaminopimelate decarboxylase
VRHIYINSGVYQGFAVRVFDGQHMQGTPLLPQSELKKRLKQKEKSYIWGWTCDGVDWLIKSEDFPLVKEDEWLMYPIMGAYSKTLSCDFNSLTSPKVYYLN